MDIRISFGLDPETHAKLDKILAAVQQLSKQESQMTADLTQIKAEVERNTTVTGSALALIQGFKSQLDAAMGPDPNPELLALSAALGKNDDDLAAAVALNTPTPDPVPATA